MELLHRPRFAERLRRRLTEAWQWVLSLFGWEREGRTVTIEAQGGSHGISGSRARLSVRPADDAQVERWIEYLDEELQALRDRVHTILRKLRERIDRMAEDLEETRRQLRVADREVEDLLERHAIGGFEWELVGIGWFLVGVVAATWGAQVF